MSLATVFFAVWLGAGCHVGFMACSKAAMTASILTTARQDPAAQSAPAAPKAGSAPPLSTPQPSGPDPALIPLPIPDTVPEMLAHLRTRVDQIRGLIDSGSFGSVYVPAFQAKDLALALDSHVNGLPSDRQVITSVEVANLVRVAYMLDALGDIGNRQQISEAFVRFASAAKGIDTGFSVKP